MMRSGSTRRSSREALPFGVLIVDVSDAEEHFVNGLEVLFLTGVASFELLHEKFDIHGALLFAGGEFVLFSQPADEFSDGNREFSQFPGIIFPLFGLCFRFLRPGSRERGECRASATRTAQLVI